MRWELIRIGPRPGGSSNWAKNHRPCYSEQADREYARDLDELIEDIPTGSIKLLDAGLLKAEDTAKSFALFQR
jgi:hypothetical protein